MRLGIIKLIQYLYVLYLMHKKTALAEKKIKAKRNYLSSLEKHIAEIDARNDAYEKKIRRQDRQIARLKVLLGEVNSLSKQSFFTHSYAESN